MDGEELWWRVVARVLVGVVDGGVSPAPATGMAVRGAALLGTGAGPLPAPGTPLPASLPTGSGGTFVVVWSEAGALSAAADPAKVTANTVATATIPAPATAVSDRTRRSPRSRSASRRRRVYSSIVTARLLRTPVGVPALSVPRGSWHNLRSRVGPRPVTRRGRRKMVS